MQVHPDIAALRSDYAPQREAQAAVFQAQRAWNAEDNAAQLLEEVEIYGAGAALQQCPTLEGVFTGELEAERLMGLLAKHYCTAIAANPLGHPPFRNGYNGVGSSILLARSGRAQLILQAREPGETESLSYTFFDATRFDAVLAGEADARIVRKISADLNTAETSQETLSLRQGNRIALDLTSEALIVDRVQRRLVVLRLLRTEENPEATREYCAKTGRFLLQSAGDIAISRLEGIIALLGRMDRTEAAPYIGRIALAEGDTSLRWQAIREVLALDSGEGFPTLCTIARRADDPLAAKAGALRAQLLETYPQLASLEADQCPA